MSIQIISQETDGERTYFKFQGKRNVVNVTVNPKVGYVNVLNETAAHRAYRGMGKTFDNFAQALNAYKSAEMKSILQYVAEL